MQHGKIEINGIGKENTFPPECLKPLTLQAFIIKLLVGKLSNISSIGAPKITPDIGQILKAASHGIHPTMSAPQIKIEQCGMWNLKIIQQPPEMRYEPSTERNDGNE